MSTPIYPHDTLTAVTRRDVLKTLSAGALVLVVPSIGVSAALKGALINHISYMSTDYKKTRDFYVDLLGFQASDEDDKQLYIWAGNELISAKNTPAATTPRMDHLGLTVDPWNAVDVQAVLKGRGLPATMSANDPHDPAGPNQSIFTRDPFGYTVQLGPKGMEQKPAPVASHSPLKAVGVNHLSYQCADYTKVRNFYTELLGATVSKDDGKQAYLWFGDAYIVVRNNADGSPRPLIYHFGWTLANWDNQRVIDELKKRGLEAQPDANKLSVMTKDLNGYPLQLCSKDLEKHP